MNRILFGAALLLIASPVLAKVTVYSGSEALQHVLGSAQLNKEKSALPAGYDLSSVKLESVAAKNAFKISLVYAPTKGPGGLCTIVADVESQTATTGGITSSHLADPVVQRAQCTIGSP